jgi:hypothetical protein
VEASLDVVAEEDAERDPLADAVEQPLGQANAVRCQLDGVGALRAAAVGEVRLP